LRRAWSSSRKACKLKPGDACERLGIALRFQSEPEKAIAAFLKGCDAGAGSACESLGEIYLEGFRDFATGKILERVKVDGQKAEEFYRKGCEAGKGSSCFSLAHRYAYHPVRENRVEAQSYYQIACDKGFERGCKAATELSARR
jgi:TPR repeat protein